MTEETQKKLLSAYEQVLEAQKKKAEKDKVLDDGDGMDPVGKGDADIDNDGDVDSSDEYLTKRRAAIKKDMKKEDLDEDLEMVKKEKDPKGGYIVTLKDKKGKLIKRHMKNGKVTDMKEEVEQLEELTAAEKKLVDQMYDKKGNLTPLGKKVFAAGQKNESVELDEAQAKWKVMIGKEAYEVVARSTMEANKKAAALAKKDGNNGVPGKITKMAESVNLEELTKKQKQALQNVKAQPKDKVSLKKAPWDKKEEVSEDENSTTPCPKCEGSTENHSKDCPTLTKSKEKDDTAVVSPSKDKEVATESVQWPVYARMMEKANQKAGATAPEEIDSKESEGSKEFAKMHISAPEDSVDVGKAIEKNLKTMSVDPVKHAPIRGGENRKEGK